MRRIISIAILVADGVEGRGGIERINRFLLRQLGSVGSGRHHFVQRTRFGASSFSRHLTVPIALFQFAGRCMSGKVEAAHINVAPRGSTWRKLLFGVLCDIFSVPYLIHLHGGGYAVWYSEQARRKQSAVRRFFRRSQRTLVLGDDTRTFVVDTLGVHADRVTIVENGVPEPAGLASPQNPRPKLVFLGHLTERKGFDVLLEALGKLAREGHVFTLTAGGDGDLEDWLATAEKLGLKGRVELLGWVDEERVDANLRTADLFVLPSLVENQPVSILEAMARALPVVATNVGAVEATVGDGYGGSIVAPGDPDALADAIRPYLQDPELRIRTGLNGRSRWEKRYSVQALAERMTSFYDELIESRKLKGIL